MFFARRASRLLASCLALLFALGALDAARARAADPQPSHVAPAANWNDAEKWAWSKIEQGEIADFDKRPECKGWSAPTPKDEDNKEWDNTCRVIHGGFIVDLLTKAPWREAMPVAGVRVGNARIEGDVNLENATVVRAIKIWSSWIGGEVNLMRARTESLIHITG